MSAVLLEPLTESEARERLVAEAMSWQGTPYHGNAEVKGAGIDCGRLLSRSFMDAGLIEPFALEPYPMQWTLHQSGERYLAIVLRFAHEVPGPPKPGDIAMFKFGKTWSHGSIVISWPTILHANPPGLCRMEDVDKNLLLRRMVPRFFSIWDA